MNIRSILWLTQGKQTLPSVRFRVFPIAAEIEKRGVKIYVHRYPKTFLCRLQFLILYFFGKKYDVCIIQKRILSKYEISVLRTKSHKIVFDFDDAVWTHQNEAAPPGSGKKWELFKKMLCNVDLAVAGNSYLAKSAEIFTRTVTIPTPLDTSKYTLGKNDTHTKKFIVGWMGTSSYLPSLLPVAKKISNTTGEPLLVSSNAIPKGALSLYTKFKMWTPQEEVSQLQSFSVGIMPLDDTPYTKGKCGFKILQYMACGAVPIASCVGFNSEIITHGVDGFLVRKESDWEKYILLLKKDRELLKKMSTIARDTVTRKFDITLVTTKLLDAIITD